MFIGRRRPGTCSPTVADLGGSGDRTARPTCTRRVLKAVARLGGGWVGRECTSERVCLTGWAHVHRPSAGRGRAARRSRTWWIGSPDSPSDVHSRAVEGGLPPRRWVRRPPVHVRAVVPLADL